MKRLTHHEIKAVTGGNPYTTMASWVFGGMFYDFYKSAFTSGGNGNISNGGQMSGGSIPYRLRRGGGDGVKDKNKRG
ncbi:MAG: hypothetical protein AAGB04_23910 [Pseudomonadota bacterium]